MFVACTRNSCGSSRKGDHRARAGCDALMAEMCPKVGHSPKQDPHDPRRPLPGCREQKCLLRPPRSLGTAGRAALLAECPAVGKRERREGFCFHWYLLPALWSSAGTLLFIRLIAVI